MSSRPSHSGDPDAARTRCVLLLSPGESPPQPLLDILRDQSEESRHIERAEHPLLALAHLATFERARLMRRDTLEDWPPRRPEKSMLVVVNREAWLDLSALFATVRHLMPAVAIWVCTERIAIEIYSGDEGDRSHEDSDDASSTSIGTEAPASASSSDATPSEAGGDIEAPGGVATTDLTEEELRELLDTWNAFQDQDDPSDSDPGAPHLP